jgi:NAD(P)-dependent dehydrogenase (short-subunit alcohol dehydrogenase family)
VADRLVFDPVELTGPMAEGKKGWWDVDLDVFESVLRTNTMGTVVPSRVFAKQMAAAGGGAIVNFGSMNTYRPLTRVAAYAMSKAAIANWTQFLAQYLAPAKIRVNAIAPGFFVNDRSRKILCTPEGGLIPRGEQVMAHTPAGRFGEAQELLGCVDWLLDDEKSGFVTGITVPVDGGFLASAGV